MTHTFVVACHLIDKLSKVVSQTGISNKPELTELLPAPVGPITLEIQSMIAADKKHPY